MSSIEPDTPLATDTPRETTTEPTASVEASTPAGGIDEQQQQQQPAEQSAELKSEIEEAPKADIEKLQLEFQEKARKYLAEQTSHIVVPSFAKWFDLNEIHSIEKKSFPDFFLADPINSYKTPQAYKYIRDFIVNTFRLNPKEYLTVTAVRRNLSGDVTNIIRIHQFLEKWGLINYQIDPRTKPSVVGPQYTGHFQITLDTPQGLAPFIPPNAQIVKKEVEEPTPSLPSPAPEIKSEEQQPLGLNLEIRRDIYATGDRKSNYKSNNLVQYACSVCGTDATEVRYHNLKIKSYTYNPSSTLNNASILCSLCFDQGLFPSNFTSSDFIQLQKSQKSAEWSEQEILLLLEGIEMFATYDIPNANGSIASNSNAQWDKISEHVGTKSREQCIIKFIQLPIEDKFLTKLIKGEDEDGSGKSTSKVNETLVQEVVKKLIETKQGQDLLQDNSTTNLQESILEESNLINQVIELTLEKFNLKLEKFEALQGNIIKIEDQLNLERKQVLMERWIQFEKIQKLKQQRPDLSDILDDLIQPVRVTEINKSLNPVKKIDTEDKMEVDETQANDIDSEKLPISISQPKTYQYWSG
ncbi:RSC8 [[Candida] subhashii]|uniref:RSC8 n=1 Tax=[Candida] subhashii TaxID=561895 RepID=A0A8J5QJC9_9ASCO|nr:RSC8 [[Candida] subhashii]KAG7662156.1 RSC8 [[Candida] subhashii]